MSAVAAASHSQVLHVAGPGAPSRTQHLSLLLIDTGPATMGGEPAFWTRCESSRWRA